LISKVSKPSSTVPPASALVRDSIFRPPTGCLVLVLVVPVWTNTKTNSGRSRNNNNIGGPERKSKQKATKVVGGLRGKGHRGAHMWRQLDNFQRERQE